MRLEKAEELWWLSNKVIAKLLKLRVQTISALRCGRSRPGFGVLQRIKEVFGVPIEDSNKLWCDVLPQGPRRKGLKPKRVSYRSTYVEPDKTPPIIAPEKSHPARAEDFDG